MGIKHNRTLRLTEKLKPEIFDILVKLNRFSTYLPPSKDTSDDKAHIQAVCLATLGKTIKDEGLSTNATIHFIEQMFEYGKHWNGEDVRYFHDRIDNDRLSPIILGHMLSGLADGDYRIDKYKIKNRLCYMSNGYKMILKEDLL